MIKTKERLGFGEKLKILENLSQADSLLSGGG